MCFNNIEINLTREATVAMNLHHTRPVLGLTHLIRFRLGVAIAAVHVQVNDVYGAVHLLNYFCEIRLGTDGRMHNISCIFICILEFGLYLPSDLSRIGGEVSLLVDCRADFSRGPPKT